MRRFQLNETPMLGWAFKPLCSGCFLFLEIPFSKGIRHKSPMNRRPAFARLLPTAGAFCVWAISFRLPKPLRVSLFRGTAHECPVCNTHLRQFLPLYRPSMHWCPVCKSLQRHRLVWLLMQSETIQIEHIQRKLLHFAPEPCLAEQLSKRPNIDYLNADLFDPAAMLQLDLCNIDLPDASFDMVYCSHVLEHVPDDRRAMREIRRVLKPGGLALILVPIIADHTFEDPQRDRPCRARALVWPRGSCPSLRAGCGRPVARGGLSGASLARLGHRQRGPSPAHRHRPMGAVVSMPQRVTSPLRALLSGASIAVVGDLLARAISLILTVLVTRALGPTLYGEYTSVLSSLALIASIIGFGLDTWLLREGGHNPSKLLDYAASVLLTKFIAACLVVVGLLVLGNRISLSVPFLIGCLGVLGDTFLNTGFAALRARQRNSIVALAQFALPALLLVLLLLLQSSASVALSPLLLISCKAASRGQ